MKSEGLQNGLGVAGERLQLVPRLLGERELHELDFLELMQADQTARVLSVRAGLTAKTRRVRAVAKRQPGGVENLVPMNVRHRHLGRRNEVVVTVGQLEEVLFEFRKLAGSPK